MADNPYHPSNLGGTVGTTVNTSYPPPNVQPPPTYAPSYSGAYSPAQIHSALTSTGASPDDATKLTAVSGAESHFGASKVSPPNKDGSRDHGVFQVNDKAWPQFGPHVENLPLDQQAAIANYIKNHQGFGAWTTYKTGAYEKYLGQVGSTTAPSGGATTGTSINTTTPAQAAGIGAMWGALGADTGQGLKPTSTMDNLGRMVSDTPSSPNTYQTMANLQLQQAAAPGNARQAQIAGQAAQLAATLQQHAAQPLTWSTHPFGSTAGLQTPQIPGTTLTSTGGSVYG